MMVPSENTGAATVCILLPTYNDARHLGETIRSALDQSFPDFRLLILDNASEDDTPEVVRSFDDKRIEYRRNETNLGFIGNLNLGLSLADGVYTVVLNSDDPWEPGFLERCVATLERNPRLVAVHTAAVWIDDAGRPFGESPSGWPAVAEPEAAFLHVLDIGFTFAAVLFRTDLIRSIGPMRDPTFGRIADTELMLRACLRGPIGYLDEKLCRYRVHDSSVSFQLYGSGAFFRLHLAAVRSAFEWDETQAAGFAHLRPAATRAVALQSLKLLHLGREQMGPLGFLNTYVSVVRQSPSVLLYPTAWLRLAFGLLPAAVIRAFRDRRRRGAMRRASS